MGLNLEFILEQGAIESALHLSPPDIDTFNATHGIQEVLNKENLLNLNRMGSKRLRSVLGPLSASRTRKNYRVVMSKVGSFKKPIR